MNDARETDVTEWWKDYPCDHKNVKCSFYGYCANLSCDQCNKMTAFILDDGKVFFKVMGGHGNPDRKFDDISIQKAVTFIKGTVRDVMIPDGGGDPASEYYEYDRKRLQELLTIIFED